MIEIDLNARILPEDHNVYVVRPGSGYGLFPEIVENSILLLELPGLGLQVGQKPDDAELRPEDHTFYDKVRLVSVLCGPCRLGEILAGDGERWVRLRLEGTKAGVEAELTLDADRRKFAGARFRQVR